MTPEALATCLTSIIRGLHRIRIERETEAARIAESPFADSSFAIAIENALALPDDDDDPILVSVVAKIGNYIPPLVLSR